MQYKQQPFLDFKNIFSGKTLLTRLIIINTAVWLAINLFKIILFLFKINDGDLIQYLGVPSNIHILFSRPWTIITYMFTQEGFFHILFNMILLYVGGMLFTEYLDEKKLFSTYIFGGIFGALFFIASYNIFPVFGTSVNQAIAIGASASVLAVFIAISTYIPDYSIYFFLIGRIKLKYVALIFIIIDIFSINKDNPGGHLAHLGGALWGFFYIMQLKKGRDFSNVLNFIYKFKNPFKKKPKFKVEYKREGRPLTDDEYNNLKAERQKKTDLILDKIAKRGYDSLTKEEKEFLFKSSNKNN